MNDNLIKTECYICMEVCSEKSPCNCATCVHKECLVKYLDVSGHKTCTICLGGFEIIHNTYNKHLPIILLFCGVTIIIISVLVILCYIYI